MFSVVGFVLARLPVLAAVGIRLLFAVLLASKPVFSHEWSRHDGRQVDVTNAASFAKHL